ncbi:holo-ACP synthase [Mucilaginibacter sp.]|uniref:holo-ACP synthase n=1 Tax=Mucilaginibacter sp. TaxID=1882438 RepID=UPI003D0AAB4C
MENDILKAIAQLPSANKFAIGNDLVFIPDFEKSLNDLFIKKAYNQAEITYCEQFDNSTLRYASTWAAKEAVYKAVKQLDASALGPKKIEIVREKTAGKPSVILHKKNAAYTISLTLSHDGDYVWAIAMIAIPS